MEITFDRRFRGPLTSANGGFACGSLAAFVDAGEVEVTLRLPPPLGRPLQVRTDDGSAARASARKERIFSRLPSRSPTSASSWACASLRVFASQSQTESNE